MRVFAHTCVAQLCKEVDGVCTALGNDKADWTVHMQALAKLRGLMAGGAAQWPSFASSVIALRESICGPVRV